MALAPDIPIFRELGLPSLSFSDRFGLFAPKGTPADAIAKLNAAVVEALGDPTVQSRLVEFGQELFPREGQTPEVLGEMAKADAERWCPIIRGLGTRAE
jgi:tripartite-type tricarboxylate transporter receptor subunit TctC